MKKTKKNLILAGAALGCLSLIPVGLAIPTQTSGSGETGFVDVNVEEFLTESYLTGDTVTLPEMQYNNGTSTTDASCVLLFPDGQGYVGETAKLTDRGEYTLVYYATQNGKRVETRKSFYVAQSVYSMSGANSTLNFGKASEYSAYEAGGRSGIVTGIAKGEKFLYNRAIDMNELSKDDALLNFSVLPRKIGTADAMQVVLTLTDITDESNYVTIVIKMCGTGAAWKEEYPYATANAVGQDKQGLEAKGSHNEARATFLYDGNYYVRHVNDIYGSGAGKFSLSGMPDYKNGPNAALVGTEEMVINFDYAEKRVYANGNLVIDLDDARLHGSVWNGFKEDKCYLSVSGEGYNSSELTLLINELDGSADFGERVFADEEPPELTVQDAEMLATECAVVGQPFKLPTATAKDVYDLDRKVDVRVYRAYGTSAQSFVQVKDGYFTPTQERTYTIVYKTSDESGNVAEKLYEITALNTDKKISLDYGAPTTACAVGEEVTLGSPAVSDANGNYTVKVSVVGNGEETTIAALTKDNVGETLKFRPMRSGEYTVKYEYSDYIFTETAEYTLNVSADGESLFLEDAIVPQYFIKNAEYDVPVYMGYTFVDGAAQKTQATLYVTTDGDHTGATPYTADAFTPTEDGTYYFTYVLEENSRTYEIPVVDVGYGTNTLNVAGYFTGYSSFTAETERVTYTVAERGGAYTLDFINELQTFNFAFNFSVPETATYTSVDVYLTDADKHGNVLKLTYKKNAAGAMAFSLNDGEEYPVNDSFAGGSVRISYSESTKILTAHSASNVPVEYNLAGEAWQGFSGQKAWLSVVFGGVSDAPVFTVNKVNNQVLNNYSYDFQNAEGTSPDVNGSYELGERVTIAPIVYADVLTPKATVFFSVISPSGEIVTSVDGVELSGYLDVTRPYEIVLSEYGSFDVIYEISEASGIAYYGCGYVFFVVDTQAPTLTIGSGAKTAEVGSVVTIAKATVTDNYSSVEDCEIYYYVLAPDYSMTQIVDTGVNAMKFKPKAAGTYVVYYYVNDEAGNVSMASYTITVTEAKTQSSAE